MNIAVELRELRELNGLTQQEAAKRSGVGQKTISSFETGARIGSIKIEQLDKLLIVYGLTLAEFFNGGRPMTPLPAHARVQCVIVRSERTPDLVSIRPRDIRGGEGGKATTLKARLTEAGFRPGQRVVIVAVES